MKRARLVVLGIAIVAAVAAAFLAKSFVGKPRTKVVTKTNYDTVQVLIAKSDIRLGDSLKASDVGWQEWPASAQTNGFILKNRRPKAVSDLTGAIARAPFIAGEPIKEQKLIKASEGGVMAAILPAGMRAISTPIKEETAAGGFILPNDRVDVILTRRMRGGSSREDSHVSDTLFTNIRILAIGQDIEIKGDKKVASGRTATLELSPRQAEQLALAQSMGDISLTLRSLTDSSEQSRQGGLSNRNTGSIRVLRYGSWTRSYGAD